jgi:hypothetical protein
MWIRLQRFFQKILHNRIFILNKDSLISPKKNELFFFTSSSLCFMQKDVLYILIHARSHLKTIHPICQCNLLD